MEKIKKYLENDNLAECLKKEMSEFVQEYEERNYSKHGWDDWDDGLAEAIEIETVLAAFEFIKDLYEWILVSRGFEILIPSIQPLNDGALDLAWHDKNNNIFLLAVIQKKSESYFFNYYGYVKDPISQKKILEIRGGNETRFYKDKKFIELFKMTKEDKSPRI